MKTETTTPTFAALAALETEAEAAYWLAPSTTTALTFQLTRAAATAAAVAETEAALAAGEPTPAAPDADRAALLAYATAHLAAGPAPAEPVPTALDDAPSALVPACRSEWQSWTAPAIVAAWEAWLQQDQAPSPWLTDAECALVNAAYDAVDAAAQDAPSASQQPAPAPDAQQQWEAACYRRDAAYAAWEAAHLAGDWHSDKLEACYMQASATANALYVAAHPMDADPDVPTPAHRAAIQRQRQACFAARSPRR